MAIKRGLKRGLGDLGVSELLSDLNAAAVSAEADIQPSTKPLSENGEQKAQANQNENGALRKLPIHMLIPGRYQPRKDMSQEHLEELANSIRSQGIIQPIVVRHMNDRYEIIAGERRWRAAQIVGLEEIPAIVRDIPDSTAIAMALIENIQRRDLNAIEEAVALQRLIDEFQMTHQEVANAVGKSRSVVTNLLRLLRLNADVRVLVEKGHIEMGHARALLTLEGSLQSEVANKVMAKDLSVRETERLVRVIQNKEPATEKLANAPVMDPNIQSLIKDLSEKLGAAIQIQQTPKGKGKLVINYNNLDELDGILEHIH